MFAKILHIYEPYFGVNFGNVQELKNGTTFFIKLYQHLT